MRANEQRLTLRFQFSPLVYTNVLEYFYYGGLIYTKTQDYERACSMFEQVSSFLICKVECQTKGDLSVRLFASSKRLCNPD